MPVKTIVEHAILLANTKGKKMTGLNVPGHVTEYTNGSYSLIYTTPFSGFEVLPGQTSYIVDIWFDNKKIFTHYFSSFDSIPINKTKRQPWADEFLSLT